MPTTTAAFDVEALIADSSHARLIALLADDVAWVEVDGQDLHAARGRAAVTALLARRREVQVVDGLCSGDRAALALLSLDGEVRSNALLHLCDGRIVRWDGVQSG